MMQAIIVGCSGAKVKKLTVCIGNHLISSAIWNT